MASRGINKVILVGNVGGDPEVRYMPSGGAVVNLTMATSESWKDKNSGENVEKTEWHRVVFFNRLAEIVGEYVRKGSKLYVEGRLQTRSWEQDGVKKLVLQLLCCGGIGLNGGIAKHLSGILELFVLGMCLFLFSFLRFTTILTCNSHMEAKTEHLRLFRNLVSFRSRHHKCNTWFLDKKLCLVSYKCLTVIMSRGKSYTCTSNFFYVPYLVLFWALASLIESQDITR